MLLRRSVYPVLLKGEGSWLNITVYTPVKFTTKASPSVHRHQNWTGLKVVDQIVLSDQVILPDFANQNHFCHFFGWEKTTIIFVFSKQPNASTDPMTLLETVGLKLQKLLKAPLSMIQLRKPTAQVSWYLKMMGVMIGNGQSYINYVYIRKYNICIYNYI